MNLLAKRLTTALLTLSVTTAITACGADSESDSGGTVGASSKTSGLGCNRTLTNDEVLNYPVPEAEKPYDITLMLVTLSGYYQQGQGYGAEQAAEEAGVDLSIVATDAYSTPAQQITQVEQVLARGTDAIVLSPADVDGSVPVVEKATRREVPVIDIGTLVNSPDAIQIVQDDYSQGQAAAEALAKLLPEGGSGLLMAGPGNATWATDRTAGFQDQVAKKYPEIEIAELVNSEADPGDGLTKFTNAAARHPTIDWIYATYNGMLPPKSIPAQYEDAVHVTGTYEPITKEALLAGRAEAVIADWPIYMGRVGIAEAVETLNGDSPPQVTCFPSPVITADTTDSEVAEAQLFPRGYEVSN
jgi:ribose transport system substrate-binding protein